MLVLTDGSTQVREHALNRSRRQLNPRDAQPNVKSIRPFGLVVRPDYPVARINVLGVDLVLPKLMVEVVDLGLVLEEGGNMKVEGRVFDASRGQSPQSAPLEIS